MRESGPRARRTEGATRGQVPAHRHLRARRRGLPHGGVAAGGDHRPPRLLPCAQRPPGRERRAGRHHDPHPAGCRAHRPRRRRRWAGGHRRPVPGVQGVGRRLPGGRRRERGARPRDRRAGVGRPRAGWRAAAAADPRAPGHGRRAVRRRRDGRSGWRARGARTERLRPPRRGPAARPRAAGRRHPHPPVAATSPPPRTPCRRPCRGAHDLAARRHPRQPARLAGHHGYPPARRRAAQRGGSAATRQVPGRPRSPRAPRWCSTTTRSPCCCCAATRRSHPPRRWRSPCGPWVG